MSFNVRLRRSVRRRIARWNLAGDLLPEVYLRLTEDLSVNPANLLQRITHPFDGMAYIFPAVDHSNRVYGYVFTFHIRYGADEETLWVISGGYERVPV
jgi:hypothetical protein